MSDTDPNASVADMAPPVVIEPQSDAPTLDFARPWHGADDAMEAFYQWVKARLEALESRAA